jgi:hypothetical protein
MCGLGPGLSGAVFFCSFEHFCNTPFLGCQMQKEHVFPFLFDTFFLLKEL